MVDGSGGTQEIKRNTRSRKIKEQIKKHLFYKHINQLKDTYFHTQHSQALSILQLLKQQLHCKKHHYHQALQMSKKLQKSFYKQTLSTKESNTKKLASDRISKIQQKFSINKTVICSKATVNPVTINIIS